VAGDEGALPERERGEGERGVVAVDDGGTDEGSLLSFLPPFARCEPLARWEAGRDRLVLPPADRLVLPPAEPPAVDVAGALASARGPPARGLLPGSNPPLKAE